MKKLTIVICLLLALCLNVNAAGRIDLNAKGSIYLSLNDPSTGNPIDSGCFSVYKVADITEENGNYKYTYTTNFSKATESLEQLQSDTLVTSLINYIRINKIKCYTETVENGKITFSNLSTGVYLVVNTVVMDGYKEVKPFLVSVPLETNGEYSYNINATPKLSITVQPSDTPTPPSDNPPQDIPPVIPVTGVLWWPVPVLTVLGLLLISAGYIKKFKYEKNI